MEDSLVSYQPGFPAPDGAEFEITELSELFDEGGEAPMRPHRHDFYQILWFRRGTGRHFVDFREYAVSPGTLFFISPGQVHRFDERGGTEGTAIRFDESVLADEESGETVFLKYDLFNALDASPCFRAAVRDTLALVQLLDVLREEVPLASAFAHRDYVRHALRMFLIAARRVCRRDGGIPLSLTDPRHRLFVRFRRVLEQRYDRLHTVSAYADALGVSPKTLADGIRAVSRTTPLRLINERIALEAKRRLLYSDSRVKEIAYALGFDDPSYFVKFFKRMTGMAPAEFRG